MTRQGSRAFQILLIILLAGCASTRIEVIPVPGRSGKPGPIAPLELGGIYTEAIYSYASSVEALEGIVAASAAKNGIALIPGGKGGEGARALRIYLREKSYVKGFKTFVSLAILADIRDREGDAILRASYLHDGEESFDSLAFLEEALDDLFDEMEDELR